VRTAVDLIHMEPARRVERHVVVPIMADIHLTPYGLRAR
jgi:hypothetical protein